MRLGLLNTTSTLVQLSFATLLICSALVPCCCNAESFLLAAGSNDSVIGAPALVRARADDTLIDIARRYDLGHDELIAANAETDRWIPGENAKVLLPTQYVLPSAPHEGIVINISELRLYYFPPVMHGADAQVVHTFPISIGRMDWSTPLGKTRIVKKEVDPPWRPTRSIREEHAQDGDPLPEVIPGGSPENPLGRYALRLAVAGYLIHGTDERKAFGIGMRVTHGCIRMYPEDIEKLFRFVDVGTPVYIVDQPLKVGWRAAEIYLEVHAALDAEEATARVTNVEAIDAVSAIADSSTEINETLVRKVVRAANGIPVVVGSTRSLLPPPRRVGAADSSK